MIEIDSTKATGDTTSNQIKQCHYMDDSETDTALNTPRGSITDATYVQRFSSSSINKHYYQQRKPSIIPKSPELAFSNTSYSSSLEQQKIDALESQLEEHVKREAALKSQLLILSAKNHGQSTLSRINKHLHQFLVNQQRQDGGSIWNESWLDNELPALFGDDGVDPQICETSASDTNSNAIVDCNAPIVYIFRLKAMIDHYTSTQLQQQGSAMVSDLCAELHFALDAWQSVYYANQKTEHDKKTKDQERMTRLLEALHKSVLKNKTMEKSHSLLIKQYESDIQVLVKEIQSYQKQLEQKSQSIASIKQQQQLTIVDSELLHVHCRKSLECTKTLLESQIRQLDSTLSTCQEERDEYETTLEMVRREMETMLEELEETRQQRVRYKSQASRLRAGLEAIQKKSKKSSKAYSPSHVQKDEHDDDDCLMKDDAKVAIRILYNEAERQADDLDRECKKQALTVNSIRKELKVTEEKYLSIKAKKNKQLVFLEQSNRDLTRRIESLEVEKNNLILIHREQRRQQHHFLTAGQSETSSMSSLRSGNRNPEDGSEDEIDRTAKIHALQIALKAAKSDAVIQRTKLSQLESQSSFVDLTFYMNQLQEMFQKELAVVTSFEHVQQQHVNKEIADSIEWEQRLWKQKKLKSFQKQFDVNLLQVDRELRTLSLKLTDLEVETTMIKSRHAEELSRVKHQSDIECEKKLQRIMSERRIQEQKLRNQLETMCQKNRTLQEEAMILYGRNMLMVHKLGRIAS